MTGVETHASDSDDRILDLYKSLREYEQSFNGLQAEVKKLASGWMVVTFAAIAFIVRGELQPQGLLGSEVLLVLIGLGGNTGLLCLWILDQRVYQQLLNAAFEIGLIFERRHPSLPPVRSCMFLNSGAGGMARYIALFYAVPMAFIGCTTVYASLAAPAQPSWLLAGAVLAMGALGPVLQDWRKTRGLEAHLRSEYAEASSEVFRRWKEGLQ
jgi:hypothetical protein